MNQFAVDHSFGGADNALFLTATEVSMQREEWREITIKLWSIDFMFQCRLSRWAWRFFQEQFPTEYITSVERFLFQHPNIAARL